MGRLLGALLPVLLVVGCGDGNHGPEATPVPTRTPVPTDTGPCRFEADPARCVGSCGGGISSCVAFPIFASPDPQSCICEPPTPTPPPAGEATPLP